MNNSLVPARTYPLTSQPPLPPLPQGYVACQFGQAMLDPPVPFYLSPAYATRVHMAVLGESGSGKSKFLQLFVQHLLMLGEAGMLIDPPKDLADAIAGFVGYRVNVVGDAAMARRVHFLDLSDRRAFRFDPFASLPNRSSVGKRVYDNMLDVKGDRLVRQILRRVPVASLEVMNRLRPRLKAAVMACGVDLDGRGAHLGLGKANALANPLHPEFSRCLDLAYPNLPADQQATFKELLAAGRDLSVARDRWESTQNALAKVLGGFSDLVLDPSGGPSLDVKSAIDRGEFIVVGLGQSRHLSYDRAVGLGGLVMDALLEAKEAEEESPPHLRKRCTLVIDEVGDFLGEDLCWALRNDRKFELRIVVGAQNVASMTRGDLDLAEFVLSQCQTVFAFSQKLRKDKEILEDRLFGGSYGFTPRMTVVQRQRGYFEVQTVDRSSSRGTGKNWTAGLSLGRSEQESGSFANARGWVRNWADVKSQGQTLSSSSGSSGGQSITGGNSESVSPIIVGGRIVGTQLTSGNSSSSSATHQDTRSEGAAVSEGSAHSEGGARIGTMTDVRGHSLTLMEGASVGGGGSENETVGETEKTSLLANIVDELEWTGQYEEGTVADQKERNMRRLHALRQAECFVSVYGHPFAIPLKIDHVDLLWDTAEEAWHAGEHIKAVIAAQREYTFSPSAMAAALSAAQVSAAAMIPAASPTRPEENAFGN